MSVRIHIGHVALRATDVEAYAAHVKKILGLRETVDDGGAVFLSANEKHHELQLLTGDPAFDHVGLELDNYGDVDYLRARLVSAGVEVHEVHDHEPGIERALQFMGPAGIVYEVYTGMTKRPLQRDAFLQPGARRLGHLAFASEHATAVERFWLDVLGLRLSDRAGETIWVRGDADHHGLAMSRRPGGRLHHHAWEVQDIGALTRMCDEIAGAGLHLAWGPVRHGPGFNLSAYLPDVQGALIEIYTDLLQIHDDAGYVAVDWSTEPHPTNLWGVMPDHQYGLAGSPINHTPARPT